MPGKLNDRVALVTAAAGAGMGQAIARRFALEGAKVVVTDAHEKRVKETAQGMSKDFGYEVLGLKMDVRNQADIDSCIDAAMTKYGRIDILYNNAGINKLSPVWQLKDEDWNMIIDTCLGGTFRLARAVLPGMIKQKRGVILNISSIAGWHSDTGGGGQACYAAAKAGIMGFTRATAAEVGQYGIRVNAIAPGTIYNPFLAKIYDQAWLDRTAKQAVLGRLGQVEDVAGLAAFLASDEGSFITGEIMCVSGGRYMHA